MVVMIMRMMKICSFFLFMTMTTTSSSSSSSSVFVASAFLPTSPPSFSYQRYLVDQTITTKTKIYYYKQSDDGINDTTRIIIIIIINHNINMKIIIEDKPADDDDDTRNPTFELFWDSRPIIGRGSNIFSNPTEQVLASESYGFDGWDTNIVLLLEVPPCWHDHHRKTPVPNFNNNKKT